MKGIAQQRLATQFAEVPLQRAFDQGELVLRRRHFFFGLHCGLCNPFDSGINTPDDGHHVCTLGNGPNVFVPHLIAKRQGVVDDFLGGKMMIDLVTDGPEQIVDVDAGADQL